jgi:transcriptional regulator with XRE-family HTH domain
MSDISKLYKIIGRRLKQRRKELGMTQSELAETIGHLRTSVANIEAGRQKAPLHVLFTLSNELGIELASIIPTNAEVEGSTGSTEVIPWKERYPLTAACVQSHSKV